MLQGKRKMSQGLSKTLQCSWMKVTDLGRKEKAHSEEILQRTEKKYHSQGQGQDYGALCKMMSNSRTGNSRKPESHHQLSRLQGQGEKTVSLEPKKDVQAGLQAPRTAATAEVQLRERKGAG